MVNKLWCVGVGPGDPNLITLYGKQVIESSDVIFCPVKSVHSESFALETVRKIIALEGKEIVKLIFPMTTKEDKARPYWLSAYEKIKEKVVSGKKCVFIVEGDPLIFSTFNSVLEIINQKKEFDVEIVPGISSFQIMACRVKLPVVDGDEILVIMPASIKEKSGCRTAQLRDDFEKILEISSTVFVLKSGRVMNQLMEALSGRENIKVFFGELCGTENEFISELNDDLKSRENHYFSIVMIKKEEKEVDSGLAEGKERCVKASQSVFGRND